MITETEWVDHAGSLDSECPVIDGLCVEVMFADGSTHVTSIPELLDWCWYEKSDIADIIKYRMPNNQTYNKNLVRADGNKTRKLLKENQQYCKSPYTITPV